MNTLSDDFIDCLGVPQGSHLGPLLFSIFINVFPSIFDNGIKVLLFANDTKLYTVIRSLEDCTFLQYNLNSFIDWIMINYSILKDYLYTL